MASQRREWQQDKQYSDGRLTQCPDRVRCRHWHRHAGSYVGMVSMARGLSILPLEGFSKSKFMDH